MTPSFDLPATLRAAAVGLAVWALLAAATCRVMAWFGSHDAE